MRNRLIIAVRIKTPIMALFIVEVGGCVIFEADGFGSGSVVCAEMWGATGNCKARPSRKQVRRKFIEPDN